MPARLFFRIQSNEKVKKTIHRVPKALFLSLILIGAFLFHATSTFADDKYIEYKTLFNGYGGNTSSLTYAGPMLQNTPTQKSIDGIWLKFSLTFPITTDRDNPENTWSHIKEPSDTFDQFIVRNCDGNRLDVNGNVQEQYCVYGRVLFFKDSGPTFWERMLHEVGIAFSVSTGDPTTVAAKINSAYNTRLNTRDRIVYAIFRKDSSFNWVKSESVDLMEGGNTVNPWLFIDPTTGKSKIRTDFHFGFDTTRKVSLWYCGAQYGALNPETAYLLDQTNDGNLIKQFGDLCGGSSYFRASPDVTITFPKTFEEALAQASAITPEEANKTGVKETLPGCDILNGTWITGSGSFMGCIAQLVYYAIYTPIAWFAGLMGNLFDFFLGYSLDDASYRADFVVTAWKVIRDISNIFFIVILIWTGLAAVFDIGKVSMKKVIPQLIINALIINFSLFATRIAVDISNIVARVFYNVINVTKVENGQTISVNQNGPGGYKPLSEKILSGFDPQALFATRNAAIEQYNAKLIQNQVAIDADSGGKAQSVNELQAVDRDSSKYANYYIVVSFLAAAIMFSVAMMFWKAAFFFLGRVIGIYMVMIFSPFAFLTRENMPLLGSIEKLRWDDWLKELTKYCTLAPIFVFFLYIVYLLVDSPFLKAGVTSLTGRSFFETVLFIAIPMLIIYFLIKYGVDLAKTYAGFIGEIVQKQATKAAGYVGGAAFGVTAVAGSRVLGGAARSLDTSKFGVGVRNLASQKGIAGWFGRQVQTGLNKTQSASFDVRQTTIGKSVLKEMQVDTNPKGLDTLKVIGLPGLSTEERKGGLDAAIKRQQEEREKQASLFEEKMDIGAYNKRKKKHYDNMKANLEKKIEKEMLKRKSAEEIAEMKNSDDKKDYNDLREEIIKSTKDQSIKRRAAIIQQGPPEELRSAEDMTNARRARFTKNLQKGSLFTQALEGIANSGAVGEKIAGILGATIGATAGALIGQQIETAGDRKAARKIGERNKVEKELKEVKDTIEKGFKDLIAIEMFQESASFNNITDPELKKKILAGEESMYSILIPPEKMAVDERRYDLSDAKKDEYFDLVAARLTAKQREIKTINSDIKKAEAAWIAAAGTNDQVQKYNEWKALLKEKNEAEKANKLFRDYKEYIKKEKEKLKPRDAVK